MKLIKWLKFKLNLMSPAERLHYTLSDQMMITSVEASAMAETRARLEAERMAYQSMVARDAEAELARKESRRALQRTYDTYRSVHEQD
jgi:hypothetical protein